MILKANVFIALHIIYKKIHKIINFYHVLILAITEFSYS